MPALPAQGHSLLGDRKCSNMGWIAQTTLSRTVLSVKQRALREERVQEDFCPSPCSPDAFTSQGYGEGSWKDTGLGPSLGSTHANRLETSSLGASHFTASSQPAVQDA